MFACITKCHVCLGEGCEICTSGYIDPKNKVYIGAGEIKAFLSDLEKKGQVFVVIEPPVFDQAIIGYDYSESALIYGIERLIDLVHKMSSMGYLDILDFIYHNFTVGILLEYENLTKPT